MPVNVPNKLHHIWLGKSIPENELLELLRIAGLNPEYEVSLYTDNTNQMKESITNLRLLMREYKSLPPPYEVPKNFKILPVKKIFEDAKEIDFFTQKQKLKINNAVINTTKSEGVSLLKAFETEIERLQPKFKDDNPNYAQMSDILRYMALYIHGGIYADTDIKNNLNTKLPLNLTVKEGGIKADVEYEYESQHTSNAIMASPARSKALELIMQNVTTNYNHSMRHRQIAINYLGIDSGINENNKNLNIPSEEKTYFKRINELKKVSYSENDTLIPVPISSSYDTGEFMLEPHFKFLEKTDILDDLLKRINISNTNFEQLKINNKTYYKLTEIQFNNTFFTNQEKGGKDTDVNPVRFINLKEIRDYEKTRKNSTQSNYDVALFQNHYADDRHYKTCNFTGPDLLNDPKIKPNIALFELSQIPIEANHMQKLEYDWRNKVDSAKLPTRDDIEVRI